MGHSVTFHCDVCEVDYTVADAMDIPPHWFAVQIAIGNQNGTVPTADRDVFYHFCSLDCVIEHAQSDKLKERFLTIDRQIDLGEEDDEEEDTEGV